MTDSSRESLLEHQVKILEQEKRRLRLALRAILPYVPGDVHVVVENALRETQ